jgi:hypothetical protein
LLELGIDAKTIVEEVRPTQLIHHGEEPSMDESFRPHNDRRATSE